MDLSFLIVGIIFFLRALSWLVIIRILMSWFAPQARGPIALFIHETSDQILRPLRKIMPPTRGIDWTPLIALIGLDLLRYGVIRLFS